MAETQDKRRVVTGKVRFSYAYVFIPRKSDTEGAPPKYSVALLIPKSDTDTYSRIMAGIDAAKQYGKEKTQKWGGKVPANLRLPLHDGDGLKEESQEPYGPEYKGCWVLNASSADKPEVVDANLNPIISQADFYSGCYGRAAVQFFPYANRKIGIGCALGNLQKLEDGEPLAATAVKASKDFGDGFLD